MNIRRLLSLALLPALPLAAATASSQGTLQAKITIVTTCSTQQALFGAQAQNSNVTVICQPGMTPYLTQSIDLSSTDSGGGGTGHSAAGGSTGATGTPAGQTRGMGVFNVVSKTEALSPPLPNASSTFASKVIYVMF